MSSCLVSLAHHGFEVALVLVQHALGRHHVPLVQALEQMMLHHAVEVLHRDGLLQRRQQLLFSSSALISSTLVYAADRPVAPACGAPFTQQAQHAVSLLLILLGHTFPYVELEQARSFCPVLFTASISDA